ncbi:EF-hand calcium-binding domain-containing protein 1 [Pitangus sulphuratus]|nr:EF-hand calcium-binding domain-containing protein 1 [Pitangus sulphuratus]
MSRKRLQLLAESLSRSTKHFSESEAECLIKLFDVLVERSCSQFAVSGFNRTVFRDTLFSAFGMTDDVVLDRELQSLLRVDSSSSGLEVPERHSVRVDDFWVRGTVNSTEGIGQRVQGVFSTFDRDNNGCITVVEWVEGLAILLRGTLEEKIKYCFAVYDLNGDGYISREEMFQMLKDTVIKQPTDEDPDEAIKDLVEIVLKKMASTYSLWTMITMASFLLRTLNKQSEMKTFS